MRRHHRYWLVGDCKGNWIVSVAADRVCPGAHHCRDEHEFDDATIGIGIAIDDRPNRGARTYADAHAWRISPTGRSHQNVLFFISLEVPVDTAAPCGKDRVSRLLPSAYQPTEIAP